MKLIVSVLSIVSLVFAQRAMLSAGGGGALDGATFEYQLPTDQSGACDQACPLFYQKRNGKLNGAFKFEIYRIYELNATGGECCAGGSGCNIFTPNTCNFHVLFQMFNYFNQTIDIPNKAVSYSAFVPNTPVQPSRQCTQADIQAATYTMCVRVDISYEAIDIATTRTIANQDVNLRASSVLVKLKISNWNFATSSTGYRIKLDLGVRGGNYQSVILNPGNNKNPATPLVDNFNSMSIQDVKMREAAIGLYSFIVFDTTVGNITRIRAPIALNADFNGRFVDIDVPRNDASTSATIYFNLYFPTLAGEGPDQIGAVLPLQVWFGTMFFLLVLLTYL